MNSFTRKLMYEADAGVHIIEFIKQIAKDVKCSDVNTAFGYFNGIAFEFNRDDSTADIADSFDTAMKIAGRNGR